MIKLQHLNVVKIVESEFEAEKWIAKGFERVGKSKQPKPKAVELEPVKEEKEEKAGDGNGTN